MERNPNKNHCKTNVIYLLIHVAQASTSLTFGFQKFFFSIYQCFSSIHHPHQHHHFHSITNTPKWSNPKRASMRNPSSSFASIYLLHPSPIILLIICTTKVVKFWIYIHVQSIIFFCIYLHFTSTHPHHHIHSIYWHTKVAKFWICVHVQFIIFFCIYLFFTFLILIIIFKAFINTQKGPNLNVHSWEIHHVLFRLSIFNILHHHHFHSIYKHPKKLSNPDCASMGNPWLSFSSIKFSHPSASSSFTQCYKHPKLVISWLCIHGQSKIFFCFHLFFRYIIVIVIIIIIIFTTL